MGILEVTDATFDSAVLASERPVFVDFWAAWCGPCRAVAPVIEELARELPAVQFAKVDVDRNPAISGKLRIQSIPTFVLFERGKVLGALQGAQPKTRFLQFLETHVPAMKPPVISVSELAAHLAQQRPVHLFDLREERDFSRSHLRRSRCVAPDALEAELAKLPAQELVVLICRTGERSRAEAVRHKGARVDVRALEKGLLEWEGSGKPTFSTREEQELDAST